MVDQVQALEMGLDTIQELGKGIGTRLLFVLFAVFAFLLFGALSSDIARADLLGSVTDLVDKTQQAVKTTLEVVPPVVEGVVEIVPPVVEVVPQVVEDVVGVVPQVVEIVPPVVEGVVEIVPPVVGVVPPVVEDVVGVVPPVAEDVIDDLGPILPPVDDPLAPPDSGTPPTPNEPAVAGPAQDATRVLTQEPAGRPGFGQQSVRGVTEDAALASTPAVASSAPAWSSNEDVPPLTRVPSAGLLPASVSGAPAYVTSTVAQGGGGSFDGGMDPYGLFAGLAAFLALCLTGLIREGARSGRSIFLRHEARPG